MNIRSKLIIIPTLAFSLASGTLRAQSVPAVPPPGPPSGDVLFFGIEMGTDALVPPDAIGIVGLEGELPGKTVAGAPFTANFSSQTTQTLADGNHINRTTTGTLARDAQGRTRRDMTLSGVGPWSTSGNPKQVSVINDPVAATHFVLEPDKKIARQLDRTKGKGHGHEHSLVDGEGPGKIPDNANVTTTSLGTQTTNGLAAEGTRTTRTIPAGTMGNEKPVIITVEKWYSADLQTNVKTTRNDPLMGDTVMQLTNIQRQEPDASLFKVPADYIIKQGGHGGKHHVPLPPPAD